jgi:Bacteriocin-protection, YdeI or OmpD-Associated/Domain of unknown function (DU1801)
MGTSDPRIDLYIARSGDFAKPVLTKFRELVHQACPDVTETIKWGMPAFDYKGPFCGMAAFKHHCVIGFWKASLLFKQPGMDFAESGTDTGKMNWGAPGRDPVPSKIIGIDDLPPDKVILKLIKQAMKLNEQGVKVVRKTTKKPPLAVPKDLASALKANRQAAAVFKAFPPSHQREYIEWIVEAKKEETRQRRLQTTIEQLSEGKSRNWKYERK